MRELIARFIQGTFRTVGIRTLDRQFLVSFGVMAILAVAGSVLTFLGLRTEPSVVNRANQQLALVEEVTGDLLFMQAGAKDPSALGSARERFQANQQRLLQGDPDADIAAVETPAIRDRLAQSRRAFEAFVDEAQTYLGDPDSANLQRLADAREEARSQMRVVVEDLEDRANSQLTFLRMGALAVSLIIVVLVVLGRSFGVVYLMNRLHRLREHLLLVSHGDLAHALPIRDEEQDNEIGQMFAAYNQMREHRVNALQDIRDSAHQAGEDSESLSLNADQITANAEESGRGVDHIANSIQEVNEVVQDVANNISGVSQAASQSSQTTQSGQQLVSQASQRINDLKEASSRVNNLIATIQAIAKKTDLLALNAAIEAANAGEAGKGFAVVADEVRKLSEQTAEATRQVEEIVSELHGHSDASVEAMGQVESTMGEVLEQIEGTDNRANQIASAAEELAATMSETADNVATVNTNVNTLAGSVNLIQEASQTLGRLGFALEQRVQDYRLYLHEPEPGTQKSTVDFGQAKIDHFAWKTALRKVLNGDKAMSEQEATSHEHCRLGKWVYGEGMRQFGHLKPMKELEAVHKDLHASVRKVLELYNGGRQEEARREYEKFERLSQEVVAKLDELKAQAGAG